MIPSRIHNTPLIQNLSNINIISTIKENKNDELKLIGTHSGAFHCDEALAIAMLSLLPMYQDYEILRSRNGSDLEKCCILVDVGKVYDVKRLRFDHHIKDFDEVLEPFSTKLSSAGLVYKHFGRDILLEVINACSFEKNFNSEMLEKLYSYIYRNFVEHIDAIDNGINITDGQLRYKVTTNISTRVRMLNPRWNENQTNEVINECFKEAVILVGKEFISKIEEFVNSWIPARNDVKKALNNRYNIHHSGEIIKFDTGACPYETHVLELEDNYMIKYVIYPDISSNTWRIRCMPERGGTFIYRKFFPKDWRGLNDIKLDQVVGINGCIFVHPIGFVGGHISYEGALHMAQLALQYV